MRACSSTPGASNRCRIRRHRSRYWRLAQTAVRVLPAVLTELRGVRPDLIVHDAACLWGAVAARELGVPAASSFTTFAFNQQVPSPTGGSMDLLLAAARRPGIIQGYLRARWELHRRYDARQLPMLDLGNIRQPLNLIYTSRAFQPGVEDLDQSYRFIGPSIGARPPDPWFPADQLRDPVLYVSLGTVFKAARNCCAPSPPHSRRSAARCSSRLDRPTPPRWIRCRPTRTTLCATTRRVGARRDVRHPRRDEQRQRGDVRRGPDARGSAGRRPAVVAGRVAGLGAGLAIRTEDVTEDSVRALARELLDDSRFRAAATTLQTAQHEAGGSGVPPTSSITCSRPALSTSRLGSILRSEADRCHPSSCCC